MGTFRKLFGMGVSQPVPGGAGTSLRPMFAPSLARQLQTMQQNTDDATKAARDSDIIKGRTVSVSIPVTPTSFSVSHGLSRKPNGYTWGSVTAGNEAVNVTETARDASRVTFTSNQVAAVTASVRFY